ncbi:putative ribonuclease H-like domain-containing protein [Tanacetum coccineum]
MPTYFIINEDARDIWLAVSEDYEPVESSAKARPTMMISKNTEVSKSTAFLRVVTIYDQHIVSQFKFLSDIWSFLINVMECVFAFFLLLENEQDQGYDHEEHIDQVADSENKTGEVEKVYGMMAGLHADKGGADVSDATAEFAMMGISPKDKSSDDQMRPMQSCDSSIKKRPRPNDLPPAVEYPKLCRHLLLLLLIAGGSDPAASRNRPAVNSADRPHPAGWSKRPATISANRPIFLLGDPSTDNDIDQGGMSKLRGGDVEYQEKGHQITDFKILDFENNKVLFTDTDCLVLSEEFQLPDASQVVLRIPRKHDLYTFHISDLQPEQKVTCLVAKASLDESTRWHRRMAYVNFKTINKLAKEGLVDGLPLKICRSFIQQWSSYYGTQCRLCRRAC